MNKILRIVAAVVLIYAIFFIGINVFMKMKGKEIIETRIETITHQEVSIGDIQVLFPFNLRIQELSVGEMFKVKDVVLGAGLINLFNKEMHLTQVKLIEPQIVFQLPGEPKEETSLPPTEEDSKDQSSSVGKTKGRTGEIEEPYLFVNILIIQNGVVSVVDPSGENKRISFNNVNMRIERINVPPRAIDTDFDLSAEILRSDEVSLKSKVSGKGFVNMLHKDMEAKIEIHDLDSNLLSSFFTGTNNRFLKNTVVDLSTYLDSKNNDMTVNCWVKVKEFAFDSQKKKESQSDSFENIILQGLQSLGQGIEVNFSFKTKMDDFRFDTISFSGTVRE